MALFFCAPQNPSPKREENAPKVAYIEKTYVEVIISYRNYIFLSKKSSTFAQEKGSNIEFEQQTINQRDIGRQIA